MKLIPTGETRERKDFLRFFPLLDNSAHLPPECERVAGAETQTLATQRARQARWMNVSNKGRMLLATPNGLIVHILGSSGEKAPLWWSYCAGNTHTLTHMTCDYRSPVKLSSTGRREKSELLTHRYVCEFQ